MAEYEALIHYLKIASELDARHLFVRGDSELVASNIVKRPHVVIANFQLTTMRSKN